MFEKSGLLLLGLIFILIVLQGSSASQNPDTQFTAEEKVALVKFRNIMIPSLHKEYQKEDYYLIHWLRAKNLDLQKSKEMLEKSFRWRKENNIDNIGSDPKYKTWMDTKFPTQLTAVDREGRPVLTTPVGLWDIRSSMEGGQRRELAAYLAFLYELIDTRIRDLRNSTGTDLSQSIYIMDMSGYSPKRHGCVACLPFSRDLITHYESYYPAQARQILLINAPQSFKSLLEFIRPLMSPPTRRDLKIYRNDKAEWSRVILDLIDPDQLPPQYGGSKGT